MSNIIGIDIGGSTTKIVGFSGDELISPLKITAGDPITSAYGALGRFLMGNNLKLSDVDKLMLTGVGATYLMDKMYGLRTERVDEFVAVGTGGKYLSGIDEGIVVSLGTGTAFVSVKKDGIRHFGGTGVGGGTVVGLSNKLLASHNIDHIVSMAQKGDLGLVDLTIGDISKTSVSNMNAAVTASNFGKLSDLAKDEDIAAGVLNMVFQTVGMLGVFAARAEKVNNIVFTGNLTVTDFASSVFKSIENIYDIPMTVPANSDFATAIGAALCGKKE